MSEAASNIQESAESVKRRKRTDEERKAYNKAYYLNNREKVKARSRAWNEANQERSITSGKAYYAANREKLNAAGKAYREANRNTIRAQRKAYRTANLNKIKAAKKAWNEANRAKNSTRSKAYSIANRKKIRTYSKAYCAVNSDRIITRVKAWAKANPEKRRAQSSKRRALELGATVGDVAAIITWDKKWRRLKRVACHWCRQPFPPKKCHADHIVPLSKGGSHSLDNLCVSCAQCNLSKKAKLPDVWNREIKEPVLL